MNEKRMNEFQQAVGKPLTSKELPESHVTGVTSVPILIFHGLCSRTGHDVRDRQSDIRHVMIA